jgi:HB1, ASXL, restriction endonuclease HTH domain
MSSKKSPAKKTSAKKTEAKAPSSYAKKFGSSGNTGKPHETSAVQTTPVEPVATEAPSEQTPTTPAEAPSEQQPVADQTPGAPAEPAATPKVRQPRAKKEKAAPKPKKLSAIDAAAKVLAEAGQPMNCHEMIEAMTKKGLWTTPGGQTPHATLYSAILREIARKGKEARFTKTERGKFATA